MTWQQVQPDLPPGWAWAQMEDVAEIALGKMLDKKRQTGRHAMPYLRNINVQWHHVDLDDLLTMDVAPTEIERYTVRAGDLLACEGGEPGRCAVVPSAADGLAYQKALHRIRPAVGINVRFLACALEYMTVAGHTSGSLSGSTIKHLPLERVLHLPLPVPPTDEQRRIADALEDLRTSTGWTVEGIRRLRRRLDVLEQSVLERMARGVLLDPGRPLAATPLPVAAAGRPPTKFTYADLPPLPRGWRWVPVVDACESVECGGTPEAAAMRSGSGDVPFLKVYNLRKGGGVDFTVRPTFIDDSTHRTRLKRSIARPGDVLINIVGPPMGKVGIIPATHPEWNYNQAIVAMRSSAELRNRFLALALRSRFVLDRLVATSKATAGQFNISLSACRELPIPVPPVDEQDELVAEAETLLSGVDAARARLDSLEKQLDALVRSALAAAFGGTLVDQDPLDEPAEMLLKRIREDRAATGSSAGRGRQGTVRRARRGRPDQEETA